MKTKDGTRTNRMAAVLLVFIMTVALMTALTMPAAAATSGTCGENLTWTLDDNGTLTISGTGAMKDYSSWEDPWYNGRGGIKQIIVGTGVTTIGKRAFEQCDSLTAVTIPDSVTTIGDYAFRFCDSLSAVTIPASVTTIGNSAFESCDSLTAVTIPDSVIVIGDGAFAVCRSLTAATIPASVTTIGASAFLGCSSLTAVTIPASVTTIGVSAFCSCDSLTAITVDKSNSQYASEDGVLFNKNKTILMQYSEGKGGSTYTIPDSVTTIGDKAFSYCSSLTAVTIPASVTTIGDCTFEYCDSLTAVTIPASVTTIGASAFSSCDSLTAVTIPASVTTIGDGAFEKCNRLTTITVDENNNQYASEDGVLFNNNKTILMQYPEGKGGSTYTIPDSVTTIGDSAFYWCSRLTAVTIPASVTTIGDSAFYWCSRLTAVTIPASVTTIGDCTFEYCDSLTTVTIPASVTTIGAYAFDCCDSLTDVYYAGTLEKWKQIKIGFDNESLTTATLHCSASAGETNSTKSKTLDKLSLVIYENKNDSSKDSDSYQLSKNATVTSGTESAVSDEKGSAVLEYSGNEITVAKDGYVTQTIPAAQAEKAKNIYLQKETGNKPIINAVWIDNTNVYSEEYPIDLLSTESVTLSAEVTWKGGTQRKIYLMQDARRVEFSGNTLTTVLSDNFDVSEDIYIVCEDTEGNATKKKLKFKVSGKMWSVLGDYKLSLGDSITGTIPDSIPVIGGEKIGLDIPMIPLTVTFENNKFYAVLGLDVAKASKEYKFTQNVNGKWEDKLDVSTKFLFKNIKDGFKKSADSYKPSELMTKWKKARYNYSSKIGFEADLNVLGYLEGYINSDGGLEILDGGVGIKPSFGVSVGSQFWLVPPLAWEASLKGEIEAMLSIYLNETAQNFSPNGSVGGDITLKGGVVLGASGVVGISGGVEGKIGVDWDIYKNKQDYVAISGSIGAYVKAYVGPLTLADESFPFAEGIIWDHPSTRVKTLSLPESENLYSLQEYSLIDRSYADSPSDFVANEQPVELAAFTPQSRIEKTLKTNVYTYSEPQLTAFFDGTKLAVWLDDDTARSDINRTALYYSYYNGSTWSNPIQLQNDGTADYSPYLAVIDDTAYITWINTKTTLSNSATQSDIFPAWEIAAATFDKETATFKDITTVTDDTAIDTMPRVFGENGEIHLVWVTNTAEDVFATGNSYAIKTASLSAAGWSAPETYVNGVSPVDSLAAYRQGGSTYIAYAVDGDGNQTDYTDKEIYLNKQQITSNTVLDSKPVFADGVLYYYENGSIIAYDLEEKTAETACGGVTNDRFTVLTDGVNRAIVYGGADGLVTELWGVMYDSESGKWGSPQAMTKLGADISSFAGSFAEDGKLQFIINKTKIIGTMDSAKPYGQTDLALLTVTPGYNLTLDDAVYHADRLLAGNTLEFYTTITNDGDLAVKDYKVEVLDGSGKVLAITYNEEAILPGQTVDFTAYYPLGDNTFSPHTVSLRLTAINAGEQNINDNTLSMPLTYENISLENLDYGIDESGKAVIYADIVNRGYSKPTAVTASLRKGSADGEVVDTVTVNEALYTLELAAVDFTVPLEHGAVYYVTLDKEGENRDFVVLEAESNFMYYNYTANEIVINSERVYENVRMTVATYIGNEMVGFRTVLVDVAEGETRIPSPMTDFGNADTVKVMLWDKAGVMPLITPLEILP